MATSSHTLHPRRTRGCRGRVRKNIHPSCHIHPAQGHAEHTPKVTPRSYCDLDPCREAVATHLFGHTLASHKIPMGSAVRHPLLCKSHPIRRQCTSIRQRCLPEYPPHNRGRPVRLDHGVKHPGPNRFGAQRRPSGNEPRSTKTSRGLRRIRHGSGLQDHHRPTGLRAPIIRVTLLEPNQRLGHNHRKGVFLGPGAQSDSRLRRQRVAVLAKSLAYIAITTTTDDDDEDDRHTETDE